VALELLIFENFDIKQLNKIKSQRISQAELDLLFA
jgi:hypothetical protein